MFRSSVPNIAPTGQRRAGAYGFIVAGVALTTAVIHWLPGADHITNISLLYLLVVIGAAYRFGSRPAVLASLLGVLAFDWFFVEPRYTFTVYNPAEWLALGVFLLTAMVISHLTATLRVHVEEARRREREATALAEASWAIASQVAFQAALEEVLRRLTEVTGSPAAAIVGEGGETIARHERLANCLPDFREEPQRSALQAALRGEDCNGEAVYVPLHGEQGALGVLYVQLGDRRLAAEELRIVESLANYATVVLERQRLQQAEAQAEVLREADKLKTALLTMVSHDFRSPLASIKASVTSLLQEGVPWEASAQHELLSGIDQETDRLNRMVGDILALSRLEADAWRPQCEAVALAEVVGAALDAFDAEDNRRIAVTLDAGLPELSLDSVQMVQVLQNLLQNALRYSPPGSPVELRAQRHGGAVTVEVMDRGCGLPVGEEERVFERFYRAPRWRGNTTPGSGLGLALCRGLVEAHDGTLSARNRDGGGAVFCITLALTPPFGHPSPQLGRGDN